MANKFVKYIVDHIPRNTEHDRRPGEHMAATTITIHNTGNPKSSARDERAWLTNPSNDRTASYHIAVDEHSAVECIPLNEHAWHSGDGSGPVSGNMTSISIEICESGDYAKALDNAVELVVKLLRERSWGVDRLRRHYDWSGKICPRLMYDGGKWTGWTDFKRRVADKLKQEDEYMLKVEDANKLINYCKAEWAEAHKRNDSAGKAEAARLANELRKASGQPVQ
jgi:N-acetylmuramoyl-L-alanine amidase CwlA